MAEFCLKCWNELNGKDYTERDMILSDESDLCEGCGKVRPVVVTMRTCKWLYDVKIWWKGRGRV